MPPLRLSPVRLHGHTAAVHVCGGGPPLVLVPSMLVLARSYRPLLPHLARHFQVFTIELPGSGHASRLRRPWPFETYAAYLADLLEFLHLDGVTLVGHSNSAAVALRIGADHPARVSRVVLADSIGADPSHSLLRILAGRGIDAVLELGLTLSGFHHILFNCFAHPVNFLHQIHLAASTDLLPAAARVRVPTLLAWGRRDYTTPLRGAHALAAVLPRSTLHVSQAGSHDWLITRPQEFTRAVVGFVAPGEKRRMEDRRWRMAGEKRNVEHQTFNVQREEGDHKGRPYGSRRHRG